MDKKSKMSNPKYNRYASSQGFSSNMNSTLDKMRKKY